MATLENRLISLAQAVALDVKQLIANDGNLALLSTTAKDNLVNAINEIYTLATTDANIIDDLADNTVLDKTYSASKIHSVVNTAINGLINGAPEAYNTLKEIADYIAADQTAGSALLLEIGKKVDFTVAQSLTPAQKLQARQNIDAFGSVEIGNPDVDLVFSYKTVRDSV